MEQEKQKKNKMHVYGDDDTMLNEVHFAGYDRKNSNLSEKGPEQGVQDAAPWITTESGQWRMVGR